MYVLNLLAFAAVGGVLASCDIGLKNWQFWVILLCCLVIKITEHFSK